MSQGKMGCSWFRCKQLQELMVGNVKDRQGLAPVLQEFTGNDPK